MKEGVVLPEASSTEELEPSNVVVLSANGAEVNGVAVETLKEIEASEDWVLIKLKEQLIKQIAEDKKESLTGKIQSAVKDAQAPDRVKLPSVVKVTIQADKDVKILSLKKVMYTITESGGEAINFAVLKKPGSKDEEAGAEGS
jgi:biopolymer transport protein ExbD